MDFAILAAIALAATRVATPLARVVESALAALARPAGPRMRVAPRAKAHAAAIRAARRGGAR